MLRIHNSWTRSKEEFKPLDRQRRRVGMYYCGPTVYDSLHLGHGRAAVVPDLMRRYLEFQGYIVRFVSNFTDIDDKIIRRSLEEGRCWREITATYMEEFSRMTAALGNRPADAYPRATDHVDDMIELVDRLLRHGNAYVADDGDVYFEVGTFESYGQLAGRKLSEQLSDASGRLGEGSLKVKRCAADFILWKLNANDPEELRRQGDRVPGWDSPWGRGRPGWHLECSALSKRYLGSPFDIHGGGQDLLFPHHENERAQNCCAFADELGDEPSVRFWVHNGFINVSARNKSDLESEHADGEHIKMSKSLGNVTWLRDLMWPEGPYDPLAIRMMFASSHYRSAIVFSPDLLDQATARLDRIYGVLEPLLAVDCGHTVAGAFPDDELGRGAQGAVDKFVSAMDDDFNTPGALAAVFELVNLAQRQLLSDGQPVRDESARVGRRCVARELVTLLHTLGFPEKRTPGMRKQEPSDERLLDLLGRLRQEARAAKNFALSDRIRDELSELGYEVRDRPGGEWQIVPHG